MFTVPKVLSVVPSPLNRRPCITVVGTRVPPKSEYASKVHIYEPLSMCTLKGSWRCTFAQHRDRFPASCLELHAGGLCSPEQKSLADLADSLILLRTTGALTLLPIVRRCAISAM